MATAIGLDWETMAPWYNAITAAEALGLRDARSLDRAAREGRIPGAVATTSRPAGIPGGRRYWSLPKAGVVFWAFNRRRGRQPTGGLQHLKPTRRQKRPHAEAKMG